MPASSIAILVSLAMIGAEGGTLRGVVVDAGGRPAAGAEVVAASRSWDGEPPAVIGRTLTDDQGRFAIEPAGGSWGPATLWAIRPGSVAASCPVGRGSAKGPTFRLTLTRPPGASFRVVDPEGRPVAGATILPRRVAREASEVPEAVGRLALATTDRDGRATLEVFLSEELLEVEVVAAGFGLQVRQFGRPGGLAGAGPKSITLRPVGRVAGRAIAEDGRGVGGLRVLVVSADSGRPEAVTDASGRFEVKEIAAGSITVRALAGPGEPEIPSRVVRRALEPGGAAEVVIPLRRGVKVVGLAADDRDGTPVAGAVVAILPSGPTGPIRATTDSQGRYEAFAPSGLVGRRAVGTPGLYLVPPPFAGPRPVEVPPAIARFELPKLLLARGVDLPGRVVDAEGLGVVGARVEARWTWLDGRSRSVMTASATSGAGGGFDLGPVDPRAEVAVSASTDSGVAAPVAVRPGERGPVGLTLVADDADPPSGRVVGPDGRGLAGASVRVWAVGPGEPNRLEDLGDLRTDAEGRYRAPRPLRRGRDYLAFASLDGRVAGRTPPFRPAGSGPSTFADLVLPAEPTWLAVEGRVVDASGRGVAGAEVWASGEGADRRRSKADAEGRFRLAEVAGRRAFLFAEATGFRFLGRAIDPASGPFELTLTALDRTPLGAMPGLDARPADRPLAIRVLAPYADRVLGRGDHASRFRTLELLSRVDPKRVLALLEANQIDDPTLADHLRRTATAHLADPDPAARLALVRAIRDAEARALAALEAADSLPGVAKALRRDCVERALQDARAINEPGARVAALAGVANRLVALGEVDRASRLLDQARPAAESLPTAGPGARARVAFAEALARFDPTSAVALAEAILDPSAADRALLGIARRLAPVNPGGVPAVLGSLRDPRALASDLPGLCHALARVDPAQALRLIDRARPDDPTRAAYALGMMALSVAEVDKPAATEWLRLAFDRLGRVNAPGSARDPACVAAALLPVAERVDPALVPELFWRAVSLHADPPGDDGRSEALLALLLARYDGEVARAFFKPAADRALASPGVDLNPILAAAALLDPPLAVRLVEALPEAPDLTFHHPKNQARLALAAALGRGAPACWEHATAHLLGLWTVATPDLD